MGKKESKINEKKFLSGFFEKLDTLTKVHRLLIYLITFVVIGGVYSYLVFLPKHDELKREKQKGTKQKLELEQ